MRKSFHIKTTQREELIDITSQVQQFVTDSGTQNGLVSVYAQGATAAIMIQENWDDSVQTDVVHLLQKLIPKGVWLHDRQDGNGRAGRFRRDRYRQRTPVIPFRLRGEPDGEPDFREAHAQNKDFRKQQLFFS